MAQMMRERIPSGELHSPRDKAAPFLPNFSSEAWSTQAKGDPTEDTTTGTVSLLMPVQYNHPLPHFHRLTWTPLETLGNQPCAREQTLQTAKGHWS